MWRLSNNRPETTAFLIRFSLYNFATGEARRTSEETLLVLEEQIGSQQELVLYAISVFMYLARHLHSIK